MKERRGKARSRKKNNMHASASHYKSWHRDIWGSGSERTCWGASVCVQVVVAVCCCWCCWNSSRRKRCRRLTEQQPTHITTRVRALCDWYVFSSAACSSTGYQQTVAATCFSSSSHCLCATAWMAGACVCWPRRVRGRQQRYVPRSTAEEGKWEMLIIVIPSAETIFHVIDFLVQNLSGVHALTAAALCMYTTHL